MFTAESPLKVAWLNTGHEPGGAEQAVLNLAGELGRLGHKTWQIHLDDGPFVARCRDRGLPGVCLGLGSPPVLDGNLFQKARDFARLAAYRRRVIEQVTTAIRQARPDALHFLWPSLVGLAGQAAQDAGAACVWEMPNVLGKDYPFHLNRWILQNQAWRFRITPLANSAYTASTFGQSPVKSVVCHLGADPERFDPERPDLLSKRDLGIPEDALVIALIARLVPEKGPGRLLEAILAVKNPPRPLHLLLIGAGEAAYLKSLEAKAAAAGLRDRLHILAPVGDPERYYGAIDLPANARIDVEPFGLSVVEAMLMAKPVLVHALGGPAETVIDGVTGWHAPDPSVETFAATLRRALHELPRWPAMGRAAREHALGHFTIARQAQRYLQVLRERLAPAAERLPSKDLCQESR